MSLVDNKINKKYHQIYLLGSISRIQEDKLCAVLVFVKFEHINNVKVFMKHLNNIRINKYSVAAVTCMINVSYMG